MVEIVVVVAVVIVVVVVVVVAGAKQDNKIDYCWIIKEFKLVIDKKYWLPHFLYLDNLEEGLENWHIFL